MNRLFSVLARHMPVLSVYAAVFFVFTPQSTAAEVDALWQKAMTIAVANDGLVPVKIIEETKAYRTEDKIDQHTISHFEVYTDKDLKLQVRLLSSIRDGKDNKKQKQKEMDQQKDNRLTAREGNIFLPENQDTITMKRTGQKKIIEDRTCIAMEYTQTLPDSTANGVVWIDEVTGVPYRLTTNPERLPEIKKAKIENARVALDYAFSEDGTEDGKWVLETLTFKADVEIKIFLLFTYKGTYHVVTSFEDHKRMEFRP